MKGRIQGYKILPLILKQREMSDTGYWCQSQLHYWLFVLNIFVFLRIVNAHANLMPCSTSWPLQSNCSLFTLSSPLLLLCLNDLF